MRMMTLTMVALLWTGVVAGVAGCALDPAPQPEASSTTESTDSSDLTVQPRSCSLFESDYDCNGDGEVDYVGIGPGGGQANAHARAACDAGCPVPANCHPIGQPYCLQP